MKYINLLFLVFFISTFGCDNNDIRLKIINRSNANIYYVISKNDSFSINNKPFVMNASNDTIWKLDGLIMPSDSSREYQPGPYGWSDYINYECKNKKMTIFIFRYELLKNNNWNYLYNNQKCSKKYMLSTQDLADVDWRILYTNN